MSKNDFNSNDILEKILSSRNIEDKDRFLNSELKDLHDIFLLEDVAKAIEIIRESIKRKEKIVIHTDYDVDGIMAGSIGYLILDELGADVNYYTNNRFTQGYGINKSSVDEIISLHPKVKTVITMDNGIVAYEAIDYLKEKGIKVIVTDHHEPGNKLPNADAVVNPKRSKTYPFREMCGAGLVWKLFSQLYTDSYNSSKKYLDLAAIATVGDVVPLLDENRIIVKEGLKLMNEDEHRLFFKILKEATNTTEVNAHFTLAFSFVPIMNAIGRLGGSATDVISMIVSKDEGEIRSFVEKLISLNNTRKELTTTQVELVKSTIEKEGDKDNVIVFFDNRLHEGIVGLVAGRIKEEYNVPTIVLAEDENGLAKGSARSIEGFNIKEALDECSDLLSSYGGHAMAAGLSLKPENISELKSRLSKMINDTMSEEDLKKKFYYFDNLNPSEINFELVRELKKLEPFGNGFEKPLFRLNNLGIDKVFNMGSNKDHIKIITKTGLNIIGWRQSENYKERGSLASVTALGYPEINRFNGADTIQFIIDEDNFF